MLSQSRFGFGLMRLPKIDDIIQIDDVITMVDLFMKSGFTYFDTAYAYPGSEEAICQALVKRYPRDSFTLANKLPIWKVNNQSDVQRIFDESLQKCGVDYFDFYLLHSIEKTNYDQYLKYNCFDFVKEQKEKGNIKHIGISFHDSPEFLENILIDHPEIEFVQLQINYLDWDNGVIQSRKNYEVACKYGKDVVVMEPVKGGTLATLPLDVAQSFTDYDSTKSQASWALRFVSSLDGVMTVLSGMSSVQQMEDNISTMKDFVPLSKQETEVINSVRKKILSMPIIPCTSCRYCEAGCPMSIPIPDLFIAYNSAQTFGSKRRYINYYNNAIENRGRALDCIQCGQCESVCPQHLHIIDYLKSVSKEFEQ